MRDYGLAGQQANMTASKVRAPIRKTSRAVRPSTRTDLALDLRGGNTLADWLTFGVFRLEGRSHAPTCRSIHEATLGPCDRR